MRGKLEAAHHPHKHTYTNAYEGRNVQVFWATLCHLPIARRSRSQPCWWPKNPRLSPSPVTPPCYPPPPVDSLKSAPMSLSLGGLSLVISLRWLKEAFLCPQVTRACVSQPFSTFADIYMVTSPTELGARPGHPVSLAPGTQQEMLAEPWLIHHPMADSHRNDPKNWKNARKLRQILHCLPKDRAGQRAPWAVALRQDSLGEKLHHSATE